MGAYIDKQFMALYSGGAVADLPLEIDRLIEEAEELIDYYTLNKARSYFEGSEVSDPELYAGIRNAVASQVIWNIDIKDMELEQFTGVNSLSLGSFSVSFDTGGGGGVVKLLSPRTLRILRKLGLLYRGVSSR